MKRSNRRTLLELILFKVPIKFLTSSGVRYILRVTTRKNIFGIYSIFLDSFSFTKGLEGHVLQPAINRRA